LFQVLKPRYFFKDNNFNGITAFSCKDYGNNNPTFFFSDQTKLATWARDKSTTRNSHSYEHCIKKKSGIQLAIFLWFSGSQLSAFSIINGLRSSSFLSCPPIFIIKLKSQTTIQLALTLSSPMPRELVDLQSAGSQAILFHLLSFTYNHLLPYSILFLSLIMDCRAQDEATHSHSHSHSNGNGGGDDHGHDHSHSHGDDHLPPPDTYASQSLYDKIHHDQIRTLNESEPDSGSAIFKAWENRLDTHHVRKWAHPTRNIKLY
jgi:hypothetical protein